MITVTFLKLTVNKKNTISRVLVVIFIVSGLTDLGHGLITNRVSKSASSENFFNLSSKSHPLNASECLSGMISEAEFEEESRDGLKTIVFNYWVDMYRPSVVLFLMRQQTTTIFQSSISPIFLLNCQILI